jgi:hypothetical protein
MKSTIFFILFALSAFTELCAQSIQNGRVFDSRFENHSKDIQLHGKIKSIKEVDSVPHYFHSYGRNKKQVSYIMNWTFNSDGNYKEQSEYRDNGSLAARTLFNYNNKGQLVAVIQFNGATEIYRNVCTVDVTSNTAKSEFYLTGFPGARGFTMVKYNKQGKVEEIQYKGPSAALSVTKYSYDQHGNLINNERNGFKKVDKYDGGHHLTEATIYKDEKMYERRIYKYDPLGNKIEEKLETADQPDLPGISVTIVYVYDSHNNWITQTRTDAYSRIVVERTITYY